MYGYVLQLSDDKWYVGITQKIVNRLVSHKIGKGAKWVKLHSPFEISDIYKIDGDCSAWEKDTTLKMMKEYGWRNVRGYCWTQCNLKRAPKCLR